MKIYVASSWRCEYQPEAVRKLRALGHEVYDFRGAGDGWGDTPGAGGFSWSEVDPNWQSWPTDVPRYLRGLNHPRATEGFDRDMDALILADACLLVNPCGQSAHAEFGWACGAGKLTAAWCPAIREPDLMIKMAGFITDEWAEIEWWSKAQQKYARLQIALIERITSLKAQVARLSAPVSREEVNDYEVSYEGDTVSEWFDRTIAARAELAKERP